MPTLGSDAPTSRQQTIDWISHREIEKVDIPVICLGNCISTMTKAKRSSLYFGLKYTKAKCFNGFACGHILRH